ncbi:TPA: hypothetical protein ACPOIM_000486 [Haemophilus influenzae]
MKAIENSEVNRWLAEDDKIQIINGTIAGEQQSKDDLSRFIMADYTSRVSTLESRVENINTDVNVIKSNCLTKSTFYKISGSALITLIVSAGIALWAAYSNLDVKIASLADRTDKKFELVDQRFQQIEEKIHSLDVRLTKVEMRLDNVDKKLDRIDDKLELLIQQKQAKKITLLPYQTTVLCGGFLLPKNHKNNQKNTSHTSKTPLPTHHPIKK